MNAPDIRVHCFMMTEWSISIARLQEHIFAIIWNFGQLWDGWKFVYKLIFVSISSLFLFEFSFFQSYIFLSLFVFVVSIIELNFGLVQIVFNHLKFPLHYLKYLIEFNKVCLMFHCRTPLNILQWFCLNFELQLISF